MTGRELTHPECVPSAPQDEQLAPDGLHGIGKQSDIDCGPQSIWGCFHHREETNGGPIEPNMPGLGIVPTRET